MIPPTLGLDINTKHTHLQTLARQDKERRGEETCQGSRTHRAPVRTRTRMHMHTNIYMVRNFDSYAYACYAPTFRALKTTKEQFYGELQTALLSVTGSDKFVVLEDFNARVGSRAMRDDEWGHVRGPHGAGECNSSGKHLLSFLSHNNAAICNTWLCKKNIYKQSWQHPATKQWHAIDFVNVDQRDRQFCHDSRVVLGADCGSDHRMVCLTFQLQRMCFPRLPCHGVAGLQTLVVRRAMGYRCGQPSGPSNGIIKAFGLFLHLLSGMRTVQYVSQQRSSFSTGSVILKRCSLCEVALIRLCLV